MTEIIAKILARLKAGEIDEQRAEAMLKNLAKNKGHLGKVQGKVMACKPSRRTAQNATWRFAKVNYNFGDGFKVDYHPPTRGFKPPWMWVRMQDYGV